MVLYTHVELYTWGTRDTPRGGYPGWIPGVGPDTLDTRDTRAARIYPGYPVPRAGGKIVSTGSSPQTLEVLSNQCCTLRQMRLLVLLAALLASAPRSDAQHVNFYRMSSNGCATGVKSDTGFSVHVIKYVWKKYRTRLINAARTYEGFRVVANEGDKALAEYVGRLCLYAALWYIHIYPTVRAIGTNRNQLSRMDRALHWASCGHLH